MTAPVMSPRRLNRALLARQLLLHRADLSIPDAVAQIGGLQMQYPPAGYVGLWSRLRALRRDALTDALEARSVVQGTLFRSTIHLVDSRQYWRFAVGIRQARRAWGLRVATGSMRSEAVMRDGAEELRRLLADGPRTVAELGPEAAASLGFTGLWTDLVRVPPSGTWDRRRADRLALAEGWLGPEDATPDQGREQLIVAYLRGFGLAPTAEIAKWAGVTPGELKAAADGMDLVRYRDEAGHGLLDLPDALLPDPDTPAPVRFLGHWDTATLSFARRAGVLPERHRPAIYSVNNPFSTGTVTVDGEVAATWRAAGGRIEVVRLRDLTPDEADDVERERAALDAFCWP